MPDPANAPEHRPRTIWPTPEKRRDELLWMVSREPDWRWSSAICEASSRDDDPYERETDALVAAELDRVHGPVEAREALESGTARRRFPALLGAIQGEPPGETLETEIHDLVHTHDEALARRIGSRDLGVPADRLPRGWTWLGWIASLVDPPDESPFRPVPSAAADRVRETARAVAARPGMHLSQPSWSAAENFWAGYDTATARGVLGDLRRWVAHRVVGSSCKLGAIGAIRSVHGACDGWTERLERPRDEIVFGMIRDCIEGYLDECGTIDGNANSCPRP